MNKLVSSYFSGFSGLYFFENFHCCLFVFNFLMQNIKLIIEKIKLTKTDFNICDIGIYLRPSSVTGGEK